MDIHQSIFMTNVFAERHPHEHVRLWKAFEEATPVGQRSGFFGADNVAYIAYLKKIKDPTFTAFFNADVEGRSN